MKMLVVKIKTNYLLITATPHFTIILWM